MARQLQLGGGPGPSFPYSSEKFKIGDGDAGILATVRMMQSVTFGPEGVGNVRVRGAALDAIRGTQRGMDEITSVFQWVKDHIEFRGEYAETIQTPFVTLQLGAGDCDDHSTLLAAMLESIGFETRFNTISTGGNPDEFSHVFAEVKERGTGRWLAIDSTVRSSYPGWRPSNARRMKIRAARPAAMRGIGIGRELLWLGLGLVASSFAIKKRR
jgi:Transglutaminase-like superfamily